MSDPADIPGRHVTPRADPVQPDKPGSGNQTEGGSADSNDPGAGARRGADERSDAGLKNVRGGYGGSDKDDDKDDPSAVPNRPASDAQ